MLQNSCEKGKLQVASKANSLIQADFTFNCANHTNGAWHTPRGSFNCTWKNEGVGEVHFYCFTDFLFFLLLFGQPKSSHNLSLKWAYLYILIHKYIFVCVCMYGYGHIAKFSAEKRAKNTRLTALQETKTKAKKLKKNKAKNKAVRCSRLLDTLFCNLWANWNKF